MSWCEIIIEDYVLTYYLCITLLFYYFPSVLPFCRSFRNSYVLDFSFLDIELKQIGNTIFLILVIETYKRFLWKPMSRRPVFYGTSLGH